MTGWPQKSSDVWELDDFPILWFVPQTALELNGVLNSSKKQALFHHHFRVRARVPGLVCLPTLLASCSIIIAWFLGSLLFWRAVPSSFPGSGVPACLPIFSESCSIIISWFRLGFRGLSPYSFGILFHHPFLVPARVPGLVSLFFRNPVPSSFPCSG